MNRSGRLLFLLLLGFSLVAMPLDTKAAGPRAYEKPEDVVAWLYRDFIFTATMSSYWKGASLADQPKETLLLYFTEELASLFVKDRQCAEKTNGICNLDFSPIFDSQDPAVMDLEIAPADKSNTVPIQFTNPGYGKKVRISYEVAKTSRGWRIKDIIYIDGHSLKKILSQ